MPCLTSGSSMERLAGPEAVGKAGCRDDSDSPQNPGLLPHYKKILQPKDCPHWLNNTGISDGPCSSHHWKTITRTSSIIIWPSGSNFSMINLKSFHIPLVNTPECQWNGKRMTIFPLLYSSFTLLQILWNPAESFRGEWNTYCKGLPLAVRVTPAIHSRCAFSYQVLPNANIVIGEVTKSSVFSGISCYVYLVLAAQQHCLNLILLENKRQPCLLVQDFRHVS